MKPECEQVMAWRDSYLDSELDARTTLDVQRHLACCPECAGRFAAESRWQRGLADALRRTPDDAALWRDVEGQVARSEPRGLAAAGSGRPGPDPRCWRFWLWPSPVAPLGLAAVWAGILIFQTLARDPVPQTQAVAMPQTASTQVLVALRDQRRLADELLESPATDPAPTGSPPQSRKPTFTRSDRV